MSTYARGSVPITLVIGRPWSHKLTWTGPAPTYAPVDLTGMTVEAALVDDGLYRGTLDLAPAVARDDLNGTVVLSLSAADTTAVPEGPLSASRVTFTSTDGETYDFVEPVNGVLP